MIKENVFVFPNDLSGRLGSKQFLYNILDIDHKGSFNQNDIVGIFLPSYKKLTSIIFKRHICQEKDSKLPITVHLFNRYRL